MNTEMQCRECRGELVVRHKGAVRSKGRRAETRTCPTCDAAGRPTHTLEYLGIDAQRDGKPDHPTWTDKHIAKARAAWGLPADVNLDEQDQA